LQGALTSSGSRDHRDYESGRDSEQGESSHRRRSLPPREG